MRELRELRLSRDFTQVVFLVLTKSSQKKQGQKYLETVGQTGEK